MRGGENRRNRTAKSIGIYDVCELFLTYINMVRISISCW